MRFGTIVRTIAVLILVCGLGGSIATPALAQSSPMPEAGKRQWPSQSGPQHPVEVRICSCLYRGENIPIGQTICMQFEGRHVRATCDTVVNNPSWSISSEKCPST